LILSATAFLLIAFAGHLLAGWTTLWRRLSPNSFLAELIAHAVRIVTIAFGLVVALNLMGATALMGTILGGAGVFGLAIGFALRDSLENYISSIMLSLRQPFRANDHVVIDDHEGIVVRLTTRATVLMTLDGNHLRIPNSNVFKGIILNYTRNPERRFEFDLGVDAEDDPVAAMKTGLDAIRDLDFVLADPKPDANIETVGDSNIVVKFLAWVNQNQTDFRKARSLAIRAAKNALEENGFTLPEPIYRLRFDESFSSATGENLGVSRTNASREASQGEKTKILPDISDTDELLDVRPDLHLEEKVNEEREQDSGTDLLDNSKPVE
jgi:small-conductance mechanosensitive channel